MKMNMFMTEMPNFIKREMEQLHEIIKPLAKKVSKYTFWAFFSGRPFFCKPSLSSVFLIQNFQAWLYLCSSR